MTLILRQTNTLFIFNICQKKEDIQIELIDLLTLKFCLFLFELLVLTCQYVELLLERLTNRTIIQLFTNLNNSFDIIDRFILNRESYYPLGSKRRTHIYILKKDQKWFKCRGVWFQAICIFYQKLFPFVIFSNKTVFFSLQIFL